MKTWMYMAAVGMLTATMVACGKSDAERAQELAENHDQIVNDLDAMGIPDYTWSESQLDTYQHKLDQLDRIDGDIEENNETSTAQVLHPDDYGMIRRGREEVEIARDEQLHHRGSTVVISTQPAPPTSIIVTHEAPPPGTTIVVTPDSGY